MKKMFKGMRRIFSSIAGLSLLVCSCSISEQDVNEVLPNFTAELEPAEASTKTYLDEYFYVVWNNGDYLDVFEKSTVPVRYRFSGMDGSTGGALIRDPEETQAETGTDVSSYYAIFPHEMVGMDSQGNIIATIHDEQTYSEYSFGPTDNVMAAVSSGTSFSFKNVGGWVVLKLYGEGAVSKITLKGNANEVIAGRMKISFQDGLPTAEPQPRQESYWRREITMSFPDGPVTLGTTKEEATEFWFVLRPVELAQGVTFVVTDPSGRTFEKVVSKSYEIQRNVYMGLRTQVAFSTPVSSVSLDPAEATLAVGETKKLTATVLPENAADKSVTWASDNTDIATVDAEGKVTGKSIGTATITVTTTDGGKKATCAVTVSPIAVTDISLNKTTLSLVNGTSETLTATVLPENATDKAVTWTSSNTSVAMVSNGTVTAKSVGTAKITATAGGKSATCSVTVTPVKVSSITLNKTSVSIKVESSTTLSPTVLPTDAADRTVTWSSSNTSVATVNSNGEVTGIKAGTAKITATAHDGSGVSATCSVTVVGISSIAIYSESLGSAVSSIDLYPYETHDLSILCRYSNGTSDVVSGSAGYWQIVSENVATCTFGLITAVKRGHSTTVTVGYQSHSASCTINVLDPAPSEAIDLGLSVKWGNRNLGATSITADGGYYTLSDVLNYNNSSGLDVSVKLSDGEYRTPTKTEMQELIDGCNVTQTTIDGVTGALFTSKTNGNSVFFPNTGIYMTGYQVPDVYYPTPQVEPCYWTSTSYNYNQTALYRIRWFINSGSYSQVSGPYIPFIDTGGSQYKYPIRPVYNE